MNGNKQMKSSKDLHRLFLGVAQYLYVQLRECTYEVQVLVPEYGVHANVKTNASIGTKKIRYKYIQSAP